MGFCKANVEVDFSAEKLGIRQRWRIGKIYVVRLVSLTVLLFLTVVYFDGNIGGLFNNLDGVDSNQNYGNLQKCDAYLLILTSLRQNITREAIRAGWLKDMKKCPGHLNFKHKFVVGHEDVVNRQTFEVLSEEMKLHDDILILPFVDSYWNLTVKVNLMFKNPILLDQCRYIVKVDSDVYIRADRFTHLIRRLPNARPIYAGYYYDQKKRTMPVPRDLANKFSFTHEEHPEELFPPYIGGPVYLMSNSVALSLPYTIIRLLNHYGEVEEIPSTYTPDRPAIYRLEDVYMGILIKSMVPAVTFLHIAKFILDYDHVRASAQVALHNVKDPAIMARGHAMFN